MPEKQFLSEMTCPGCGHTAHVTWQVINGVKSVADKSETLHETAGTPPTFSCRLCGSAQELV